MADKILLDFNKISSTRKVLVKHQSDLTKECDSIKKLSGNLSKSWKGDSCGAFDCSSEIILKKFASVILEFNDLVCKLDFAVESKKQEEKRLVASLELQMGVE